MAIDKVFKENFTVIKPVDLNYIPDIRVKTSIFDSRFPEMNENFDLKSIA